MLQQGAVLQPHWGRLHGKPRSSGGFKALSSGGRGETIPSVCTLALTHVADSPLQQDGGMGFGGGWRCARLSAAAAGLSVNHRGEALVKEAACPRNTPGGGKTTQSQPKVQPDQTTDGDWDLAVLPGSVLPLLWCDLCLFMYHYFGH